MIESYKFRFKHRSDDYWQAYKIKVGKLDAKGYMPDPKRTVEIYESPTGRSVRIYVDGNEIL